MITRLLAAAAALTALAAAPAPGTPRPGQWEASVHPRAIPIPDSIARDTGDLFRRLMTEPYTSKLCLKRKAADPASLFAFTGDANKSQKSCTATHVDLHDGQMTGEAMVNTGSASLSTCTYSPGSAFIARNASVATVPASPPGAEPGPARARGVLVASSPRLAGVRWRFSGSLEQTQNRWRVSKRGRRPAFASIAALL